MFFLRAPKNRTQDRRSPLHPSRSCHSSCWQQLPNHPPRPCPQLPQQQEPAVRQRLRLSCPGRGEYAKQRSDIGTPFSCAGSLVPCTHDSLLVPPPPSPFFLPPPLHRSSLALTHPSTSSPIKSRRRRRRFESTSAKKIDSVCETNQQTQRRTKSSH